MVPSEVMVVDRVPILGSGKVDNVAVARLVQDHTERETRKRASVDTPETDIVLIATPQTTLSG